MVLILCLFSWVGVDFWVWWFSFWLVCGCVFPVWFILVTLVCC